MTWSLASYTAQGTEGFGVLREDGTLVAPTELKRWSSTLELLEDWDTAQAVLKDLNPAEAPVIEYDALLPPLRWPRKVICAGVNYRKHMREMGGEIPDDGLAAVLLPQGPHHLGHRPPGPDRDQLAGPRPVRLGSRTGRRHRD